MFAVALYVKLPSQLLRGLLKKHIKLYKSIYCRAVVDCVLSAISLGGARGAANVVNLISWSSGLVS